MGHTLAAIPMAVTSNVVSGVLSVSTSIRQSIGELYGSAAAATVDTALALSAYATAGYRQDLLVEQYEMRRRLPRGAPPPPAMALPPAMAPPVSNTRGA